MFALVAKKNTHIGIRLSEEVKDKLTKMAEANKRTLSDYIRLLLEDAVDDTPPIDPEQPLPTTQHPPKH